MTSFFRFVNKRASYSFSIISLAHAPVNVTDFSIGSINCNPNNDDKGRSIMLCKLLFFSFYNRMLIFLFFKSWEEIILSN
jgi:hypothetical protein